VMLSKYSEWKVCMSFGHVTAAISSSKTAQASATRQRAVRNCVNIDEGMFE
jgi:hypothetical protein